MEIWLNFNDISIYLHYIVNVEKFIDILITINNDDIYIYYI